jgi:hypothetical protein
MILSIFLPATLKKIAPDFYYEECIDPKDHPPYIEVDPSNPYFFAKDGTLYYRSTGKQVLDAPYNNADARCRKGNCDECD